ncbi:Ig-like domain-containing protein, partial [Allohahella marinimesophila]|uniref:Ig-like domain-containing protein n=1 Tax=Allohahella marinimesophila TaxID=1054972 RepID=UPI0031E39A1D
VKSSTNPGVEDVVTVTVNAPPPPPPPALTGLSISGPSSVTLEAGDSLDLNVAPVPADAPLGTVDWLSDNPAIASVNGDGLVVGTSAGQTSIRVKSSTNASIEGVVPVTVNAPAPPPPPPPPALTGLTITGPSPATLEAGGSLDLDVAPVPADAPIGAVVWASSDTTIATVNAAGVVQALLIGDVQISVSSDGVPAAQILVSVQPPMAELDPDTETPLEGDDSSGNTQEE